MAAPWDRDQLLSQAKLCERCERFEDMAMYMRQLVQGIPIQDLTIEETNLFVVSHKNVVKSLQADWRVSFDSNNNGTIVRGNVEQQILNICNHFLDTLNPKLDNLGAQNTITY